MGTHAGLVDDLKKTGVLYTPSLIAAFEAIDRVDFVLPSYAEEAYVDEAFAIGEGQTISQPSTVAFMLELLAPREGEKVLDVGSGSGYTTALLAHVVGTRGHVYGIERVPELVMMGTENIAAYNFSQAGIVQAGSVLGLPSKAPFNRILVSASADELPQELINQLAVGGRMVICIGNEIWQIDRKSKKDISIEKYPGFVFVPLVVQGRR